MFQLTLQGIVTPVTWAFAPDWLTIEQACFLSGWDPVGMLEIIDEGGIDADQNAGAWLIEKRSLWEFQESLADILHWND